MNKLIALSVLLLGLTVSAPCHAEAPHQIGPFILGHDIADFEPYLDLKSELPIRFLETVHEIEIKPIQGFKTGLIAFSICDPHRRVIRIKLKYADSSKTFFDELRKRIAARFGPFEHYRGGPFGIVIAWKKSFIDKDGNHISLTIQHNTRDEEEKMGNSIKLTMVNLFDQAVKCQEKSQPEQTTKPIVIPTKNPWDLFVPR